MIRRPLHERFSGKVLQEIKTTTIRDKAWPMGRPIMLFNWSGKPYRSPQVNVAPVIVRETSTIKIHNNAGEMVYKTCPLFVARLFHSEGFEDQSDMDNWFRPLVKDGEFVIKYVMRFRLIERGDG